MIIMMETYLKQLKKVLKRIEGSYALCIVSTLEPNKVIVAKKDSPLIIGKADGAYVAASDHSSFIGIYKRCLFLS